MGYRGHIKGGVVVLDQPTDLPEGAEVEVARVGSLEETDGGESIPSLYERLYPIIGAAKGLPPDAARNHDHYLYGMPKR